MKRLLAATAAALLLLCGAAQAGSLRFCDAHEEAGAAEQDRLLRFAAIVKTELAASGQGLALVSRSGLNLDRIGQRYSHAGVALRDSANTPWSVRQLYYACDEKRPRIFDQGLSGFVLGADAQKQTAYISIVFLPGAPGLALQQAALDDRRALQLLGASYSANSYPFSVEYQNCNQWLAELLALAWGDLGEDGTRVQAQAWLQAEAYVPTPVQLGPWMLLGAFVPWVHGDDHPSRDKAAGRYRVSLPESLERFVRARVPEARRVELCLADDRVVIHPGWTSIAPGCVAGDGDRSVQLGS